jgi:hypothetical protein
MGCAFTQTFDLFSTVKSEVLKTIAIPSRRFIGYRGHPERQTWPGRLGYGRLLTCGKTRDDNRSQDATWRYSLGRRENLYSLTNSTYESLTPNANIDSDHSTHRRKRNMQYSPMLHRYLLHLHRRPNLADRIQTHRIHSQNLLLRLPGFVPPHNWK